MFDIITFGSSTIDIFFELNEYKILKEKEFVTGKGICFPLGSKIKVKNMKTFSGGGGTNTAVTFAKQGFKTAFLGKVGEDIEGEKIIEELKDLKINTDFILKDSSSTNTSVVLNSPGIDRTILAYRGASEKLEKSDIEWNKLETKWFYLAPFSGKMSKLTEDLVNFAYENKIKVALNPGNSQLYLPKKELKNILEKTDILILNQEEASLLTGISYKKEKEIFNKIDEMCPGISIMTKGEKGLVLSDGNYLYRAKPGKSKVEDRTGAGDSFASGFVSGFIRFKDIEKAIQTGISNATSCLREKGAKNGLLKKEEKIKKVKVTKNPCLGGGGCCMCNGT